MEEYIQQLILEKHDILYVKNLTNIYNEKWSTWKDKREYFKIIAE